MHKTRIVEFPGSGDKIEFDPNKPWLITRRSKRSLVGLFLWGLIATYIAHLFSLYTPVIRIPEIIPYVGGLRLGTLWLLPVSIFLETIRRFYNDLYIFESHMITHHKGRLSLKYSVPVVKYAHIRAIAIKQSLLGRLLDYGDISFGTASEEGNELIAIGIRDPKGLAKVVDYLRVDIERLSKEKIETIHEKAQNIAS